MYKCNCRLSKTMLTILQLLADGADPRSVRCPHPALLIAATCNSPQLIQHLVNYGANINETYDQVSTDCLLTFFKEM